MLRRLKHRGLHANRLKKNPEEKAFADLWDEHNEVYRELDSLLYPSLAGPCEKATERERQVAATVIQWLGTKWGRNFLAALGYRKPSKREQCTSKSGGIRCELLRGHTTPHTARVGSGMASWR